MAGEAKQIGQRVAEHRATAMADMHRPGRIGRDVFDVDGLVAADVAFAEIGTEPNGVRNASSHAAGFSVRLMKPGPAISTFATRSSARSFAA